MRLKYLFILPCSILLASCSVGLVRTYEGSPQSTDQIARVIVPGAVSLDSVDGKDFSSPPDQESSYEIELLPGRHILAFRYAALWGAHDSQSLVTSNYAIFDTSFTAGETYRLEYKVPTDEYDAIELKNKFEPDLRVTSSNQKLSSRIISGPDALRASVAEMNAQSSIPKVAASEPIVDVNKLETAEKSTMQPQALPDADTAVKEDTVKRLKFWWLMSSESEREEFMRWMKTVDESFSDQKPVKQE